jgi:outer membrane protein TolC
MSLRVITPLRRRLVLSLVLAAGCGFPPQVRAQELDPGVSGTLPEDYLPALKPLIAAALGQSPDLMANELSVEISEAQKLRDGVSGLLPHLGTYVEYGVDSQAVSSNTGNSSRNEGFTYNANATQPIFQWGALKNQLAVQKVQVAISEKNYAEAYRGFVANLRKQYLGLVGQKLGLRNARFNLKLKQDGLALADQQLKSGTLPAGAIVGPQLELAQAQLNVEQAEQDYAAARRSIARELGRKEIGDELVAAEVPAPAFSLAAAQLLLAEFLREGASGSASVQAKALNVRNWDLQYRIAKVNLLPKLSVQAQLNQQSQSTVIGNQVQQTFLLTQQYYVVANWNIFDGLYTRGQKQVAFFQKQVAEHDLQATTDAILESAQDAEKSLEFAWRQLEITDRYAQIAQGQLDQMQDALKRGDASPSALDTQRSVVYLNEAKLAGARSGFLAAWADFVSLVGHDPAMRNLPSRYVRQN